MKTQESERIKLLNLKDMYEKKEIEWNKLSSELRVQAIELGESNVRFYLRCKQIIIRLILVLLLQEKAERKIQELKNKISILQQELGNSEAVQKDFVRLSQSLQVDHEHSMKFNIFTVSFDYFSTIRWN